MDLNVWTYYTNFDKIIQGYAINLIHNMKKKGRNRDMVRSYECPGCGAPMQFDADKQKMVCEHCGTSCTTEELDNILEHDVEREDEITGEFEQNGETEDFRVFKCPSCGAELLTDDNTSATFCSFCGRPNLMESRLSGADKPSVVIPFKIEKDKAREKYRSWAKKGLLTPSGFYAESTIEKITGMYVPFWLYNYNARLDLTAECTKVRHETKGDYRYTYTDYFMVTRDVEAEYDRIPVDASEKMPDDVMDKIEPFGYQDLTGFEMPYLSGYYSEKYNYTADEMSERAEKRIRKYILDTTRDTIKGYTTVNVRHSNSRLQKIKAEYGLMPVWILNYRYKDKDYMFALNGQTGKIVADKPISKGKAGAWFGGLAAVIFTILMVMGKLL